MLMLMLMRFIPQRSASKPPLAAAVVLSGHVALAAVAVAVLAPAAQVAAALAATSLGQVAAAQVVAALVAAARGSFASVAAAPGSLAAAAVAAVEAPPAVLRHRRWHASLAQVRLHAPQHGRQQRVRKMASASWHPWPCARSGPS